MSELKDLYVASVGAAAALLGLLFVAVTFAADKVSGVDADMKKRGAAIAAFIALANIFFVSLAGLLPSHAELVTMIVAALSIYNTGRESQAMRRRFPELRGLRRFGLISLAIYLVELGIAVRVSLKIVSPEKLGLVYTVFGLYSYALSASWQLLGLRD